MAAMTNSTGPDRAFRLNSRPLIVGGALMGLGGLLGLAGIVVSGSCLAAAVRDWANRQEVPPTELARQHWQRARARRPSGQRVAERAQRQPPRPAASTRT